MNLLSTLLSRLVGAADQLRDRPATGAIVAEMKDRATRAEHQAHEIRDARIRGIEGAFFPSPEEERRAH